MNLFTFFHDAAFRFLGRRQLTVREEQALPSRIKLLNRGFGGSDPIDYSDPITRLAYTFSYAPRHAIIWREYHKKRNSVAAGDFSLNTLGTACGPEIIGTLEGAQWEPKGVLTCYSEETEPGWRPLLEAVVAEYYARRGSTVALSNAGLARGVYTLGSLVLSEIVKQGNHRSFRTSMVERVGPTDGLFLDITKCRMPDGDEPFLSDVFGFGFYNPNREGLKLRDVINAELDDAEPCYCKLPLTREPSMNFFLPRFR